VVVEQVVFEPFAKVRVRFFVGGPTPENLVDLGEACRSVLAKEPIELVFNPGERPSSPSTSESGTMPSSSS